MKSKTFQLVFSTALDLQNEGLLEEAVEVLLNAKLGINDQLEWEQLWPLLQGLPQVFIHQNPSAALLYTRALRCRKDFAPMLDWIERHKKTPSFSRVMLECTAGLNGLGKFVQARDMLRQIIPELDGEDLGIAWARLGFALFNLKEPWEEAYKQAVAFLRGEELGRAQLNFGYALSMSGRDEEAEGIWLEALSHFQKDPYFSVWIRYNLATIAMNNLEISAERHLLNALQDISNPKVESLRASVWNGLGSFRNLLGEWDRADFSYLQAIVKATDVYAKQSAHRGRIRNQYLSGRLNQALETLEVALHEPDVPHFLLYVVQAKVYLKLGQTKKAKVVLEKAGEPKFELEKWPWSIAAAELARQEGRFEEAIELLEGLPLNNVDARADVRQFPLLFELLHGAGKPVPEPLEYVQGTTIAVQAQGVLHVSVNSRPVDIIPTGRVGELLVFLLEQRGQASLEAIGDAMYPDVTEAKRRRQAVWKLVDKLREALGWQDAVLSLRGAYQLDPKATWHYDIAEARRRKEFGGEFLAGVYSEWALEVGRELQELGPGGRRLGLN